MRNCSNVVKIRHTVNAKERLAQAHKLMGITNKLSEQLEEIFNDWARVKVTDLQVRALIQGALKPPKEQVPDPEAAELSTYLRNVTDLVYEYALNAPSQQLETTKGTLFGAYNAVTGYYQNIKDYKDGEAKLRGLLFCGTPQMKCQAAFNLCTRFHQAGDQALPLLN
ncbi:DUF932 domain-containing protein [Paraflavisolibacter sp. H34]|uniref:DUF932 domain-containing protein n=1 Tax=Huijunlia imazamoxiresistens TaxID=3127457 RepID=UPI003018B271